MSGKTEKRIRRMVREDTPKMKEGQRKPIYRMAKKRIEEKRRTG